jgi:aminoglycoside adenylyltransferase-like protein
MWADIPQPVQQVLNTYISLINDALPGLLTGLYLHGSLALGAYNPGLSDIDFTAITSRRCTPSEIAALRVVHRSLIERYWQEQIEGSYLQWQDLGGSEATIPPHPRRIAWLLDDYGIQWTVLGVLRQFYTFRERAIVSKMAAGEYALAHIPEQWHPLIQEAINIRMGTKGSLYQFRIVRAIQARLPAANHGGM